MPKRVLRAVSLAAVLALVMAGAALADAGGQGTVSLTQHGRDVVVFTNSSVTNPCTGASGTLVATAKTEVFHETYFTTGPEFWYTGTAEGSATFTPDVPGISASGHFAEWFGESYNNKNDVQHDTSTFQLTGSDGSRTTVHFVDHLSTNANGVITVVIDNFTFHCG